MLREPAANERNIEVSKPIQRALISVSNKDGVVEFARKLANKGVAILSTGGTAKALREAGIEVTDVSDHTGSPVQNHCRSRWP